MTDKKVVALPGVTPQVTGNTADPDVVASLKVLLKKAEAGEIRWLGAAWVGGVGIGHSLMEPQCDEGPSGALLTAALGAISYMDKRMGDAILCGAIDVPTELDKGED